MEIESFFEIQASRVVFRDQIRCRKEVAKPADLDQAPATRR